MQSVRNSRHENSLSYTPEQLIVTAGASEALHLVMQSLVDDGDLVLCPDPGFVSYAALARFAGGRPIGMPLTQDLHIDVEKAKALMDGARVLVLNSRQPDRVGRKQGSIKALVEYADDAGVMVVPMKYTSISFMATPTGVLPRFGENVVTINAVSKTYAMTGWRLGYLAASEDIVEQCLKVHQYCQACATSISQYAALEALYRDQRPVKLCGMNIVSGEI